MQIKSITERSLSEAVHPVQTMVDNLVDGVARHVVSRDQASRHVVSLESLDDGGRRAIHDAESQLDIVLESLMKNCGIDESKVTAAQRSAARNAGLLSLNYRGTMTRPLREPSISNQEADARMVTVEAFGLSDMTPVRTFAKEAYDETDNRNATAFSITYNMQSARQDDFGETLFPTLTIPSDQAGIAITVNKLWVMDNVDRNVSGATYELRRKNILRAVADPTVLRKEQTRAVPVYRSQSQAEFIPAGTLAPRTVDIDGQSFQTSGLLFSQKIDLLGISETDALMASGVQNQTDTLEAAVVLQLLYFKIGNDVVRFDVTGLPYGNFVPGVQGDYKLSTLNFETTSVLVNKSSLSASGTALTGSLAAIVSGDYIVRLHIVANGTVRVDTGNLAVYPGLIEISQIKNATTGALVAPTDAIYTNLKTALAAAEWLGYEVLAYRSNSNRRQQGQFIDVSKEYQRYMVPYRSPITARHPAHVDGQIDASDVQALITATRIRTSNESVTAILQQVDVLSRYVDSRDDVGEGPELLGVGRHYVRAAFIRRPWDALLKVDSLSSHKRADDIQASLVNEARDIVYRLYRDSEYKAAADALHGGAGPIPEAILATDPVTARYLLVPGDTRLLGNEFKVRVVSTLDVRMQGKIVIAFGVFDDARNTSVNPLNNGNMLWAPELVLTANIGRGGQYSRETLVQPRYLFINNLPVLGLIEVSNIPNVLNKMPLFVNDVTPVTP